MKKEEKQKQGKKKEKKTQRTPKKEENLNKDLKMNSDHTSKDGGGSGGGDVDLLDLHDPSNSRDNDNDGAGGTGDGIAVKEDGQVVARSTVTMTTATTATTHTSPFIDFSDDTDVNISNDDHHHHHLAGNNDESEQSLSFLQRYYQSFFNTILQPFIDDTGSIQNVLRGLMVLFVVGGFIGVVIMPKNSDSLPPFYSYVSSGIGYIYFLCWSISFYPQIIINYKRKTTHGLSVDFCSLNVLGFTCYTIYNVAFYYSTTIQQLYKQRMSNGNSDNKDDDDIEITVQSNDVAFAIHALILSSITLFQIAYYDTGIFGHRRNASMAGTIRAATAAHRRSPSKVILWIGTVLLGICLTYPMLILITSYIRNHHGGGGGDHNTHNQTYAAYHSLGTTSVPDDDVDGTTFLADDDGDKNDTPSTTTTTTMSNKIPFFNWLDYLYLLSYIKILISLIKYIPQVILNVRRQSTLGWSIWNIVLDFTGGILSDLQLVLDCTFMYGGPNYAGITGNIAKFGLGFVSIIFDIIFMIQHYVLYKPNNNNGDGNRNNTNDLSPSEEPLLPPETHNVHNNRLTV